MSYKNPSSVNMTWHKVFSYVMIPFIFVFSITSLEEAVKALNLVGIHFPVGFGILQVLLGISVLVLSVVSFFGLLSLKHFGVFCSNALLFALIAYNFFCGVLYSSNPFTGEIYFLYALAYTLPLSVIPVTLLIVNHRYYKNRAFLITLNNCKDEDEDKDEGDSQ